MKKTLVLIVFLGFFLSGFGQNQPEINPIEIQKNFENWKKYQANSIFLSSDFKAFDENSNPISKELFLNKLSDESYIPIRLKSENIIANYQLFKLISTSDTSIKATISEIAFNQLQNDKKEGKPFPEFSFKDLNGNLITNETLREKIVVIKCWYIHCANCIKEFPEVNKLVAKYKNRKDIVFISLAEDSPQKLKTFLVKKPLSYAVVPNMKNYMNQNLQLNAFPTHIIVDKQGVIEKVLPDYKSLEMELEKSSITKSNN